MSARSFAVTALALAAVFSAGGGPVPAQEPSVSATEVKVTFVGNEGFLIECAGKKILIDALYRTGVPGYDVLSSELQTRIETAQPPFDGIDVVLATHVHNDHFHPIAVGKFLLTTPSARFVTTNQTVERMREEFPAFADVEPRVRGLLPPEGETVDVPIDGISVKAMTLHHGRSVPFQNLGFLVEVGGVKLVHLGDTAAMQAEIGRHRLAAAGIDVAFVPFWMLLDPQGTRLVREAIAPAKVVPMHVPSSIAPPVLFGLGHDRPNTLKMLRDVPGVIVFETPLEERTIRLGGG
jgi:L-ascorbate metabolism protein UlaG (beta-lactamase superfamily)